MQKEYEEALLAEIDAAEETAEREVISVFFGGGTPSQWMPECSPV
mgnify:FL=1